MPMKFFLLRNDRAESSDVQVHWASTSPTSSFVTDTAELMLVVYHMSKLDLELDVRVGFRSRRGPHRRPGPRTQLFSSCWLLPAAIVIVADRHRTSSSRRVQTAAAASPSAARQHKRFAEPYALPFADHALLRPTEEGAMNASASLQSQGKLPMNEFVRKLLSNASPQNIRRGITFHFFEQEYTFTCFEYQALYVADEFYHTRYAVRLEHGLESLSLSRKFFRKVCSQLIHHHNVCLWGKRSRDATATYELIASGSSGNKRPIEDVVGSFSETESDDDYVAALHLDVASHRTLLSLAYFSHCDYNLRVMSFCDDDDYSK